MSVEKLQQHCEQLCGPGLPLGSGPPKSRPGEPSAPEKRPSGLIAIRVLGDVIGISKKRGKICLSDLKEEQLSLKGGRKIVVVAVSMWQSVSLSHFSEGWTPGEPNLSCWDL